MGLRVLPLPHLLMGLFKYLWGRKLNGENDGAQGDGQQGVHEKNDAASLKGPSSPSDLHG